MKSRTRSLHVGRAANAVHVRAYRRLRTGCLRSRGAVAGLLLLFGGCMGVTIRVSVSSDGCEAVDFDQDGDVDFLDWGAFQRAFTG